MDISDGWVFREFMVDDRSHLGEVGTCPLYDNGKNPTNRPIKNLKAGGNFQTVEKKSDK